MAWICLKSDSSMGEESRRMAFMAGDDINTPPNPDKSAPGSIVFTADMSAVYVKDQAGTWTESTTDAMALLGLF